MRYHCRSMVKLTYCNQLIAEEKLCPEFFNGYPGHDHNRVNKYLTTAFPIKIFKYNKHNFWS